jgi:C-terminal processing protease CtpA/Prc
MMSTMVNAPPPTVSTGRFMLGRCCLAALVGLAACSQLESEEAKEVAREANVVAKEATKEVVEVSREVAQATKEQLDKVDTEKIEQTLEDVAGAMGAPPVGDPANPGADPLADAVQAIACDKARARCTVTADFADRARQNSRKLAAQLRMTPVEDAVAGIRIDAIDAGTPAELVGLRAGDVITHVNGTSAKDPVMLYMSVRAAQSFVIDYQRSGEARTLQVDVV